MTWRQPPQGWGDMMGRVKRSTVALGAGAVSLLLSGCSGISSGEAATIDGTTISQSDLQEVTDQFNAVAQQPATPSQVLDTLIKAPALKQMVAGSGQEVTDNELLSQLASLEGAPAQPNPLMADYLHGLVYSQMVGGEVQSELLADVDVEVNPRYGSWDPETLTLADETPEWIAQQTSLDPDN